MLPGSQSPGHVVDTSSTTNNYYSGSEWTEIPVGQYSSTAESTSVLQIITDQYKDVFFSNSGRIPIRVFDSTGIEFNDGGNRISGYHNITGLAGTLNVDKAGRIYISLVDVGGGFYRCNIYSQYSRGAAYLIAHTADYNAPGDQNLIADNLSGVGGKVTIDALGADADIEVAFHKHGVVSTYAADGGHWNLSWLGLPLDTTAGRILRLWYGTSRIVRTIRDFFAGQYASVASSALLDSWNNSKEAAVWPMCQCVYFHVYNKINAVGGTSAIVNLSIDGSLVSTSNAGDGLTVDASWVGTVVDLNPLTVWTTGGTTEIEWTTTQSAAEVTPFHLTTEAVFVALW